MSGLNLTEASHVIIMHPFYYGEGEDMKAKARAYEKQGKSIPFSSVLLTDL